jgi:hypothetical protein
MVIGEVGVPEVILAWFISTFKLQGRGATTLLEYCTTSTSSITQPEKKTPH